MPERRRRPDLDERFSLHPLTGEEVLEKILGTETGSHHGDGGEEGSEDEDS